MSNQSYTLSTEYKNLHIDQRNLIDSITDSAISGLYTDGAHHKQYELEQIIQVIAAYCKLPVESFYDIDEDNTDDLIPWEEGIPG